MSIDFVMRTILSLFVVTSLITSTIATGQAAIPIDSQIIAYKPVGETNEALILKRYGPSGQEEGTALPCAACSPFHSRYTTQRHSFRGAVFRP